MHGDPYTPTLRAYVGDTMVFQSVAPLMNRSMVWTLSGHSFWTSGVPRMQPEEFDSIGIAGAGMTCGSGSGWTAASNRYFHFNGRSSKFSEGRLGNHSCLDKEQFDLKSFPAGSFIRGDSGSRCRSARLMP